LVNYVYGRAADISLHNDQNLWRAICGSNMPSATKETPTYSLQDIWAELRYGTVPSLVQKLSRKFQMSKQNKQRRETIKKIHTVRPAGLQTRNSFNSTMITKNPVFDCAVALCTMRKCVIGDY
jgi:hypothetical protein